MDRNTLILFLSIMFFISFLIFLDYKENTLAMEKGYCQVKSGHNILWKKCKKD